MSKYIFRNEKGGFESAYDKNSLMKLCYEEISDLEAKLAEKDAELKKWSTQYARAYVNRQNCLIAEKVELQKQLADKDKEIEYCNDFHNQDKISFAVKQLEKVKNYIITDEKDMFGANYLMKSGYVLEFIDNQINELKGEKVE